MVAPTTGTQHFQAQLPSLQYIYIDTKSVPAWDLWMGEYVGRSWTWHKNNPPPQKKKQQQWSFTILSRYSSQTWMELCVFFVLAAEKVFSGSHCWKHWQKRQCSKGWFSIASTTMTLNSTYLYYQAKPCSVLWGYKGGRNNVRGSLGENTCCKDRSTGSTEQWGLHAFRKYHRNSLKHLVTVGGES